MWIKNKGKFSFDKCALPKHRAQKNVHEDLGGALKKHNLIIIAKINAKIFLIQNG